MPSASISPRPPSAPAMDPAEVQPLPSTSATTPGPRASALLSLHSKTLTQTLKTISYSSFAACFPTIAAHAPENLKGLHAAMLERLEGFAMKDFNALVNERNVIQNLNALESLLADAQRRKARAVDSSTPPPVPHTLPPPTLLTAHLNPHLSSQQSQLNAKTQTVQSQNADLWEKIQGQRKEIETLTKGVEDVVGDLEAAGKEVGGVGRL